MVRKSQGAKVVNLSSQRLLRQLYELDTAYNSFLQGYYGKSPNTYEYYRYQLATFITFVKDRGFPEDVRELAKVHILAFLEHHRKEGAADSTLHIKYRTLKRFFNWLTEEEYIPKSPMERINPPTLTKKVIIPFSPEDIRTMLRVCETDNDKEKGARDKAIILMLFDTGLRVSELCSLSLQDMDKGKTLWVHGKGSKQRWVALGQQVQKALRRYLSLRNDEHSALFVGIKGPLTRSGILQMVKERAAQAGVRGVRTSPHTLRHTFAINFLRNGGNVFELQYLLGHSSLDIVKRYLGALNAEDAARAHQKYSPADKIGLR